MRPGTHHAQVGSPPRAWRAWVSRVAVRSVASAFRPRPRTTDRSVATALMGCSRIQNAECRMQNMARWDGLDRAGTREGYILDSAFCILNCSCGRQYGRGVCAARPALPFNELPSGAYETYCRY